MRFGWKVLIPVGLGWIVLWGAGMVLLPHFNYSHRAGFTWLAPAHRAHPGVARLLVGHRVPSARSALKAAEGAARRSRTQDFDAVRGRLPRPADAGPEAPRSPRAGRTVDATEVEATDADIRDRRHHEGGSG